MSIAHDAFYVTSGTMAGSAPSYVVRTADESLFGALNSSEYCYVLSSRQMGKSSLMIRTLRRLKSAGVATAMLDLTMLGFNANAEQWYNSLLEHLGSRLNLQKEAEAYAVEHAHLSPLRRWLGMIRHVLLTHIEGRIVIFIDEIDLVRNLPFSTDEFFAAIRACYNARAEDADYSRLTFCLLGVATPADLIGDARLTPFNIGRRIPLEDFTPTEAARLQTGLGPDPAANQRTMARILYWTDGHPCLTQRLCKEVIESTPAGSVADVDACCRRLFLRARAEQTEDNLNFVSQRLLDDADAEAIEKLLLYERVLRGKPVWDDETRPLVARLKLSGVVKGERERLIVRNRIYAQVFNRAWVQKHLPGAEQQRQHAAFRRGVLRTAAVSGAALMLMAGLALTAVREAKRANSYAQKALALLYASDMSVMQTAYERNDFRHMRSLLAETQSNPNRGFEWFYWQRKLDIGVVTLSGHDAHIDPVTMVEFSPFGPQMLVVCANNIVRMWDTNTGRELLTLRHAEHLYWAGMSIDGRMIITSSAGGLRLWDMSDGHLLQTIRGTGATSLCTDVPRNMTHVAIPSGHMVRISILGLRGQWLVDRRIAVNDGDSGDITADGRRKLIKTGKNSFCIWNSETQRPLGTVAHADTLYGAAFSPDGSRIVTYSRDRTAKVWDTKTQRLLLTLTGHQDAVRMAAFSPDGRRIVTGGDDRLVILWDAATGKRLTTLKGSEDGIDWVSYSPDGRSIVTADRQGTIKIWNAEEQSNLAAPEARQTGLNAAVFSHAGSRLLTCGDNGIAKVWDATSKQPLFSLVGHKGTVNGASYSLDDRRIVTAGDDGTARVWDAATGALLLTLREPRLQVFGAAFSPDGTRIALALEDHTVRIRDAETGRELLRLSGHADRILSVAYSPNGKLIASASADRTTRIWDAATGKLIRTLTGHTGKVYMVAFSADGRRIVTGSKDRTARVWDVETGQPVLTIEGQDASILSAVFSPDGRRVLTGGGTTARLWDAANGRQMLVLNADTKSVSSVAFSPDGLHIVTAGDDGAARIWSAEPLNQNR